METIGRLERGEEDAAFAKVIACGYRHDFAFAKYAGTGAYWCSWPAIEQRLLQEPGLPSLEACLELPSQFSVTFGRDTILLYHLLRWIFFVTEEEWQTVMLDAVGRVCRMFEATDCVITNDGSFAISEFRRGASFSDALQTASQQGEGEVASLSDLYEEFEDDSDVALKPVNPSAAKHIQGQIVRWPRGRPLPKGWSRPVRWDSKGYWRYDWRVA